MENQAKIIEETKAYVKERLGMEGSGHDYWHVIRVYNNALHIADKEKEADVFVVALAALLHDIADHKFGYSDGDRQTIITNFLSKYALEERIINQVVDIANSISFKKGQNDSKVLSLEGQIVQDADRLDAIGAIGIARAFSFGGHFNRLIYDPSKESSDDTISHFYEKLLLLKDRMNTKTGRSLAEKRHLYMADFLKQFYKEWQAEK